MPRVVIVGAGISGLSVAYRLEQLVPGIEVIVLERGDRVGGTMWTVRRDGFQVELGPNGFLDSKPSTLDLAHAVGLGDQLLPASESAATKRYLFHRDKLQLLPGSLGAFARSGLLSWRGKLNLMWERFRPGRKETSDESIDAFARRRAGKEAAEVLADGLVTGIYAGDPELLSLPACFPRLAALEREYGSVMKGFALQAKERRLEAKAKGVAYQRPGKLWSLRDGLRILPEALRDRLARPPILGAGLKTIRKQANSPRWLLHGEGNDRWEADAVVLACPAYQQAGLLYDLDEELARRVDQIPYNRVAVVALGYRLLDLRKTWDGFGYIAPERDRRDVLGVQWCSSIYPGRAPAGTLLLRAMCGGWRRADMVSWDDGRLVAAVRAELRLAMGIEATPIFQEIMRWERAIPQYHVGHLERVAWIERRCGTHPGLFLGGNAYHGVALNDCTEQGEVIAKRVRDYAACGLA